MTNVSGNGLMDVAVSIRHRQRSLRRSGQQRVQLNVHASAANWHRQEELPMAIGLWG